MTNINHLPSRRDALQVGVLGAFGLTLSDALRLQAMEPKPSGEARARNVVQVILPGGCAAQESWDPKPEAPIEYRGALGVTKTKLPGVVFSQNLAKCSEVADKLTVIRSIAGKIPDHGQATYHLLTGYTPTPAIQHPQMGAVVAHELGGMNNLPAWIGVPSSLAEAGTGYLPAKFGCFNVAVDPGNPGFRVRDVSLPSNVAATDFDKRRSLRKAVEEYFRSLDTDGAAQATMDEFHRQAYGLLSSPQAQAAFTLDGESSATKTLYGCGQYRDVQTRQLFTIGERLMMARRLIEAGTRFVTVQFGGWDTHTRISNYFNETMPAFDHAFSGLITDLDQRGLLDSTLVMVLTEFGRTPKVNASAGRDHHAKCFSLVLAGAGVTRGQAFGASDSILAEPARDPVTIEDFLATAYHQLGINSDKRLMAPGERPIDIVRGGKVVRGI